MGPGSALRAVRDDSNIKSHPNSSNTEQTMSRIFKSISTAELERRWTRARKLMVERGADVLVMQNNNDWLGGYVKYFTDLPANHGYPRAVAFYRDDLMTVV